MSDCDDSRSGYIFPSEFRAAIRRRSLGDQPLLSSTHIKYRSVESRENYRENHSHMAEILPPITEYVEGNHIEDPMRRLSLDSKSAYLINPKLNQNLKKSDKKKSLSGVISKIIRGNKAAKLWKQETVNTRDNFHPEKQQKSGSKKLIKSKSAPSASRAFPNIQLNGKTLSVAPSPTDLGYESSELCLCYQDSPGSSSDSDSCSTCSRCEPPSPDRSVLDLRSMYKRSLSAPGKLAYELAENRRKMACRHWQTYLRSSSDTWQSFNTHEKYCY